MKKALQVKTKGWSKEKIDEFKDKVKEMNFKWCGKAVTINGEIQYFFAHTEIDAVAFCKTQGWKFLECKPNDL